MNRLLVGLLWLSLAAGCNSQGGVTATKLAPGAECPAGGFKLVGAGEPQLLCNGANGSNGTNGSMGGDGSNGATSLLSQTQLQPGDARCASGGVEVAAGLDSGGDGGTPNDGVLQPGEVTSSTVVCASDTRSRVGSLVPPPGAAGAFTVRANGGSAMGAAGSGGSVRLLAVSGTNGGHLKAWRTGRADATFTVPTPPAADLGAAPLNVTVNTTLDFAAEPSNVPAGTAYLTSQGLFISKGANAPAARVTGLAVAAGVTLTVPRSTDIGLLHSCRVAGTVAFSQGAPSGPPAGFALRCGDLVLSSTSSILGTGTASSRDGVPVLLQAAGQLQALGAIDASGFSPPTGSTQQGGFGGRIELTGARVYVSGTVRTNGGSGVSAISTSGGDVEVSGGSVFNQATIEANGGAISSDVDSDLTAGVGGYVSLEIDDPNGELRNRGAITANGGTVTGTAPTGITRTGGTGGEIVLFSPHGPITNEGALSAVGGSGITAGGPGGTVSVTLGEGGLGPEQAGSVLMSGNVDVSGGQGTERGGSAGEARFALGANAPSGAEVVLLGYASLSANGGVGLPGGAGGQVTFNQAAQRQNPGESIGVTVGAGGGVVNAVAISVEGGEGSTGGGGPQAPSDRGGEGGTITMATQTEFLQPGASFEVLINTGTLSATGGAGPTGGAGGSVFLLGTSSTLSSGAITTTGGAGSSLNGGAGGYVSLTASTGKLVQTAACEASAGVSGGGGGSLAAGAGGSVVLVGLPASNAGTLTARGASGDLQTGTGGAGGLVSISSLGRLTSENTVAAPAGIVVSGGRAFRPGEPGTVLIDGFSVADRWTN